MEIKFDRDDTTIYSGGNGIDGGEGIHFSLSSTYFHTQKTHTAIDFVIFRFTYFRISELNLFGDNSNYIGNANTQ